jgi:1-deoxy-D-xylulose-5-phosphate reductoisomerase
MTQGLTLLGATGSIGASTLDVIARHPERFRVFALTAHRSADALLALCVQHAPRYAVLSGLQEDAGLRRRFAEAGCRSELLFGVQALERVAADPDCDVLMAAIVGAAGLAPTLAGARAGKRVLLANKEALVMAGPFFMRAVRERGATLLPIDSEHNAVFQCLPAGYAGDPARAGVRRIVLTASGGPFRTRAVDSLAGVTPDEACAHPNWRMGRKVSVDSATMMNKGLEVIEAHHLFGIPARAIDVVVHPQSVVHSLVEYVDGSVLAQLGHPDMRTPIAQAIAWPERIDSGVGTLDLASLAALAFEAPDPARFPCLKLAYDALEAGGAATVVLNAANEVAVAAFLGGRASYPAIAVTCAETLARVEPREVASLDDALDADAEARRAACALLRLPADASGMPLAA